MFLLLRIELKNVDKKKVLLLGGTGTLSMGVLKEALNKGWDVAVLNRGLNKANIPDNVHRFIGDFKNIETWKETVQLYKFDVVVDFLSRNPADISRVFPVLKNICKQYIFISSACVYRRNEDDFPIKEDSPKPNKDWNYNVEKYNSEKELVELSRNASCYYTIVRPYITYDHERIPFGVAPTYKYHRTILERLKNGKPMFVWNGGNNITTLTYVSDFAKGVVGLFSNNSAVNEDFHITSDYQYTWNEFWNILLDKLNIKNAIYHVECKDITKYMPFERQLLMGDRCLDALFDNKKIKKAVPTLKFELNLEKGVDNIIRYYNDLDSWNYDYRYDALIDRMLAKQSKKCYYIKYEKTYCSSWLIYHIYRYLPYKIADKLCRILKINL